MFDFMTGWPLFLQIPVIACLMASVVLTAVATWFMVVLGLDFCFGYLLGGDDSDIKDVTMFLSATWFITWPIVLLVLGASVCYKLAKFLTQWAGKSL